MAPNITVVSLLLIALSVILICATLLLSTSSFPNALTLAGYVSVAGASIVFGGSGIPMKSPSLLNRNVDPMVFAMYTGIGIFFVNLPLILYLLHIDSLEYRPESVIGSIDIFCIGFLSFLAVQCLGYAKASAIWAGIGMIISFCWGAIVFSEKIINPVSAYIALALLISGVYTVSLAQASGSVESREVEYSLAATDEADVNDAEAPNTKTDQDKSKKLTALELDTTTHSDDSDLYIDSNNSKEILNRGSELGLRVLIQSPKSIKSSYQMVVDRIIQMKLHGYLFCLASGFCDGSLMVPFKAVHSKDLIDVYNYLASFGLSSVIVCPLLYILYSIIKVCILKYESNHIWEELRITMVPGLLSGVIWAAANFMSIHATFYLGIRIGFPLTQTCVIFTALWGKYVA